MSVRLIRIFLYALAGGLVPYSLAVAGMVLTARRSKDKRIREDARRAVALLLPFPRVLAFLLSRRP